jgi:hypothetical protein
MELLVVSIVFAWVVLAVIVVGLCLAAARGDDDQAMATPRDLARFTTSVPGEAPMDAAMTFGERPRASAP